jgi:hypothetical protein
VIRLKKAAKKGAARKKRRELEIRRAKVKQATGK